MSMDSFHLETYVCVFPGLLDLDGVLDARLRRDFAQAAQREVD
jgi:hypothetical protein